MHPPFVVFFPLEGGDDFDIFYPDLVIDRQTKKPAQFFKRLMDVVGSLFLLVLLAPVLVATVVTIKLTSKGPVLFRQRRIGQFGKPFTFLKFRSMSVNNNPNVHEEYVKHFLSGKVTSEETSDSPRLYKLTRDPRITPFGRFLRNTSLDELPQLLNVLHGSMSLVGPRPPVEYEYQRYEVWHKSRLFTVKPGITGLWQVDGPGRLRFDDMVRLDVKYIDQWSLLLDIKILLRTPIAVITGRGYY